MRIRFASALVGKRPSNRRLGYLLLILLAAGPFVHPASVKVLVEPDFNGDGFPDLVVGVPAEDVGGGAVLDAGLIHVTYGLLGGLPVGSDSWTEGGCNDFCVGGVPEANDRFGNALAWGDFNGDTYSDLAIGAPGEDVGSGPGNGAVFVVYGSATGLDPLTREAWHQNTPGVPEDAEVGDSFGWVVASGDFNADGFDDLAIGNPGEQLTQVACGVVITIYGSANGLNAFAPVMSQLFSQETPGIDDACEANDNFGKAVTTGDFNGDGNDDLAIGVPGEDFGNVANAGAAHVIYGSGTGLNPNTIALDMWHQDVIGVQDSAEMDNAFGSSVAAGDSTATETPTLSSVSRARP